MKAVTSTHVAGNNPLMHLNLSLRIAGGFYAVYGIAAFVKLFHVRSLGSTSPTDLYACLIVGSFILFGLGLAFSVETIQVDLTSKHYCIRKGFWPFVKRDEGPTTDVRSISIVRTTRSSGDGEVGGITSNAFLTIRLEWLDGKLPLDLYRLPEETGWLQRRSALERVRERAIPLAALFGTSIEDHSIVAMVND